MIEETLLSIIKNADITKIVFILCAYFINWFIQLGLGYYFLTYKFNVKELIFVSILGVLVSFGGRALLTNPTYFVLYLMTYILLLKVITRERIIFIAFASFFMYFLTCLSFIFIGQPLLLFSHELKMFMMSSYGGIVVGSIIEASIAGVVLFILLKYKIQLIPAVKKLTRLDIWGFILFSSMVCFLISALIRFWNDINESNEILKNFSFFDVVIAALAFISFFAVRSLIILDKDGIVNSYQKMLQDQAENYEKKIDTSFGHVYQQTTDTMRGCLLNITEALKKYDDNVEVVVDKIGDILTEDVGYNPVLKYIMMTKRLSFISDRVFFNINGKFELKGFYDLDFWMLFSQSLDIIIKAHIGIFGNPSAVMENLLQLNIVTIAIDEYPNAVTFTVETPKQPEHLYETSQFFEHHIPETDREICKQIEHPNVKRFSYGIINGKVMRIQVTYEKEVVGVQGSGSGRLVGDGV